MADHISSIPADVTTDRVEDPTPCAGCDYDLRGMSLAGQCPECGRAIAGSLDESRLYREDRAVLRRIGRGMVLAALGVGIGQLVRLYPPATPGAYAVSRLLWLIPIAMEIVGTTWLTSRPRDPADIRAARLARVGVWAAALDSILAAFVVGLPAMLSRKYLFTGPWFGGWQIVEEWLYRACVFLAALTGIGAAARALWIARLSRRIPDPSLQRLARTVFWLISFRIVATTAFQGAATLSYGVTMALARVYSAINYYPALNFGSAVVCAVDVPMLIWWAVRLARARRQHDAWRGLDAS